MPYFMAYGLSTGQGTVQTCLCRLGAHLLQHRRRRARRKVQECICAAAVWDRPCLLVLGPGLGPWLGAGALAGPCRALLARAARRRVPEKAGRLSRQRGRHSRRPALPSASIRSHMIG